ncbi:hypothetical protein GCM10011519_01410 [Marmoricola endophyticus]|uniref:Streptomycin 6-kinase n=1 Tax=Marmoricola endophyticus TaxID=2040280 RepID=A0A917EYB0_9ACTN|nr:aminoglycoside phosphotransferase family protein [Marmoricola endophyticus]GGF31776.1 hypothetical protein GCM10011519_01410 [Marmoricola endophyticus]
MSVRLQPLVRARVARLGARGADWAERLPGRLEDLCEQWGLELGRPLAGGSASYVVAARTRDGAPRVLKVLVPDPDLADEAPVLAAADGTGYARLYEVEPDALLMEALGQPLERSGASPEDAFGALVTTLRRAWQVPAGLVVGRRPVDKAALLAADLERHVALVAPAVADEVRRTVDAAGEVARALSAAYDPAAGVLAHGDAHPGNLLRRPGGGWAFVDPDGLVVEPAYDLGVVLRDHSRRLLEHPSAADLHRGWVALVADQAGADPARVAAWAFVERVSTGLFVCALGSPAVGLPFLRSAALLVP